MYTFDLEINGREMNGGKYETLDEAEDRFCTFMCNNYDDYSETKMRGKNVLAGLILDTDKATVGKYKIFKV